MSGMQGAIDNTIGLAGMGIGLAFDLAILNVAMNEIHHISNEGKHNSKKNSEDDSILGMLDIYNSHPSNKKPHKQMDDYDIFAGWGL